MLSIWLNMAHGASVMLRAYFSMCYLAWTLGQFFWIDSTIGWPVRKWS
jgi:branched-subunit amino acid ABC-type transport system permease component